MGTVSGLTKVEQGIISKVAGAAKQRLSRIFFPHDVRVEAWQEALEEVKMALRYYDRPSSSSTGSDEPVTIFSSLPDVRKKAQDAWSYAQTVFEPHDPRMKDTRDHLAAAVLAEFKDNVRSDRIGLSDMDLVRMLSIFSQDPSAQVRLLMCAGDIYSENNYRHKAENVYLAAVARAAESSALIGDVLCAAAENRLAALYTELGYDDRANAVRGSIRAKPTVH